MKHLIMKTLMIPDNDYNEYENNVSLAAMEADLKPEVFLVFDEISVKYKKLRTSPG